MRWRGGEKREIDRVSEEGGEEELVTESLTKHISIFLIIPLDESGERERPGAGGDGEESGRQNGGGRLERQRGREKN